MKINNQRKAFLDMLAWSEGTDNGRQKTRNPWLWRHCKAESYLLVPITLANLSRKPKTQINRRRTLPASFRWWDAYRKQLGLKDFSPKSQDAVALQQIEGVALYLWLIVVISVRQSTVAAISGLHCRALVMVSSSIRLTAWLQKFKEAGGTVKRDWCMGDHRDYLRSGYHHRLPVMGC